MADELTLILTALSHEAKPIVRALGDMRRVPSPLPGVWRKPGVMVVQTGMGPAMTAQALAFIAADPALSPSRILSVGFCGSLTDDVRVGDTIRAAEVVVGTARHELNSAENHPRRFRLVSVEQPIADAAARRRLASATLADIVDMETATVAAWAEARGLRVESIRVVTDDPMHDLPPELPDITDGESVRIPALLGALWRRPGLLRDLLRMAQAAGRAGRSLASAVKGSLTEIGGKTA